MGNTVEKVQHQLTEHDDFEKLFSTSNEKVMYLI